ncbi:MAG: germination protein YpeB [Clostridia bacterium]|nr:germination protein YpeB [Clostridia bacterium]
MDKKKFNNAIEKSENLVNEKTGVYHTEEGTIYPDMSVNTTFDENEINERMDDGKRESLINKQKREELNEQRRKMKAEQKQRIKELKIQKREERLARRDHLKREEQKERNKLVNDQNARIVAERREKRQLNSSRGIGGWLAAVISLATVCVILSTILIYNTYMRGGGEGMLSNSYARSFYDLIDCVDNIEVNLSKLTVSGDNNNKQRILSDVIVEASIAENDLASLPLDDSAKHNTMKYMNQVADFSKYLNNKLIDGLSFSESDISTLKELRKINSDLQKGLHELADEMGEDFNFVTLLSGEENNPVLIAFNELEYHSLEYPKMIYDGPFADEPEQSSKDGAKTAEGQADKIDKEQALKLFEQYYADYNLKEVELAGMAEGKGFKAYNIKAKALDKDFFVQISESGKLVMSNFFHPSTEQKYDRDECIVIARAFLNKCGYKSIKAVWTTEQDNTTFINFASVTEGGEIILYGDLIKVSVCMGSGLVCDVDARLYLLNHKEREIPTPQITVEEAEKRISQDIVIESARLAYIPMPSGKERLAYEFSGKGEEGEFYIYVDALTGHELQIFKVIESTDGTLLL